VDRLIVYDLVVRVRRPRLSSQSHHLPSQDGWCDSFRKTQNPHPVIVTPNHDFRGTCLYSNLRSPDMAAYGAHIHRNWGSAIGHAHIRGFVVNSPSRAVDERMLRVRVGLKR
jgi:hypothetical protein